VYGRKQPDGKVTARAWVHQSQGRSHFDYQSSLQSISQLSSNQRWLTGDFNGDGSHDLVNIYRGKLRTPEAPSALSITEVTDSTISIVWQDNSDREDGFEISWKGEREGYGSDNHSATLDNPNQESYTIKNLNDGFRYCVSVRAFNRGGKSPPSGDDCETIPVDESDPTPQEGISQLAVFNCHNDKRPVHLWTYDFTTGFWSEHGVLEDQYTGSGCPGSAAPRLIPLEDGHRYQFVAVDPGSFVCGGVNDPNKTSCQKTFIGGIIGDADGFTLVATVN
jgi:Fibronectin type III domain